MLNFGCLSTVVHLPITLYVCSSLNLSLHIIEKQNIKPSSVNGGLSNLIFFSPPLSIAASKNSLFVDQMTFSSLSMILIRRIAMSFARFSEILIIFIPKFETLPLLPLDIQENLGIFFILSICSANAARLSASSLIVLFCHIANALKTTVDRNVNNEP